MGLTNLIHISFRREVEFPINSKENLVKQYVVFAHYDVISIQAKPDQTMIMIKKLQPPERQTTE